MDATFPVSSGKNSLIKCWLPDKWEDLNVKTNKKRRIIILI